MPAAASARGPALRRQQGRTSLFPGFRSCEGRRRRHRPAGASLVLANLGSLGVADGPSGWLLAARSTAACKRTSLSLLWPSSHPAPTAALPRLKRRKAVALRRSSPPRSKMTKRKRGSVYQRHQGPGVQAPPKTSARAAAQAPYRSMTVDGAGHSPACSRLSASPPRRRAWVRDQSYDDGAAP